MNNGQYPVSEFSDVKLKRWRWNLIWTGVVNGMGVQERESNSNHRVQSTCSLSFFLQPLALRKCH